MLSVKVDTTSAMARFDPRGSRGIPVTVRAFLRQAIPDLTRRLAARINANLDAGLKSRRRLATRSEMIENPSAIYGKVTVYTTAPPTLLPTWLEYGTRPHPIEARNAKALSFYWEKIGMQAYFKRVNHPGFAGIHYAENAFKEMEGEIVATINRAVTDGLGERKARG